MSGISRRSFLGGALGSAFAAALAPAVIPSLASRANADTAPTLAVNLVNQSGHGTLWCVIQGSDPNTGAPIFLQSDGHTVYYPSSPGSTGAPLGADCNISVTGTTSVTLPRMVGGRVWFSLDTPLQFALNPGSPPGVVQPSAGNPNDPNHAIHWGFCELTYNSVELFGNISFVDHVSLPIAMDLDDGQHVGGLPAGGLASVASALRSQAASDGAPWDQLIVNGDDGQPLRILSPNLFGGGAFGSYFDDYVNQVWSKYANEDLVIDTQYTWGTVSGRVVNDLLTFDGVGTFARPSTEAIFSCSELPFTTNNDEMGNLSARLAAGFNRTTLLDSANQPSSTTYYGQPHTNHYARILHSVEQNGLGYAFPYDDVHPSGGVDVEGKVESGSPNLLTITVGSPS